jgi:hypothetical protein
LAITYGVHWGTIYKAAKGQNWKHVIAGIAVPLLLLVGGWGDSRQVQQTTRLPNLQLAGTENANWRQEQCRFQGLDRGIWTQREEDRTTWCVLNRWPVPGGLTKFRSVIGCESGWWRLAYNAGGPYVGLAQHALASWYDRVRSYAPTWWHLRPWWGNSRTMIVVTARMVEAQGWGPWSCA